MRILNMLGPGGTPEIGKIAHWISNPTTGIHGMPLEFEYVRREQ